MRLRKALYRFGGLIQRALVPGLRDSQYGYRDIVQSHLTERTRWLDLGCGHHSLPQWMAKDEKQLLASAAFVAGLDYEFESVRRHPGIRHRAVGDACRLPFKEGRFELVTSNMVVEHFSDPGAALVEIRRVLADGGKFIFHTPNARNYQFRIARRAPDRLKKLLVRFLEGRHESDVFPTFYRINDRAAVRSLAAAAGFEVREIAMVNSSPESYMLGPLIALELLVIRLLNRKRYEDQRSNMIVVLEKAAASRRAEACETAAASQSA